PQEDRVPVAGRRASDAQGDQHGDHGNDRPAEGHEVRQLDGRDVHGLAAGTPVLPLVERPARPAPLVGVGRGLVEAVDPAAHRAAAATTRSGGGGEPAGQPQVAKEDNQGDEPAGHEQPALRPEAGPEDLVEPDASVPDRVGPELDPDDEHQDEEDREDDRDREAQAPTEAPAAVPRASDWPERPAGATASSAGP